MLARTASAIFALSALAATASAETTPYIGIGADYATPHSGDTESFGSLIAGVTFDVWPEADLGVEVEFGQPVDSAARQTARLRVIYAYDFGQFTGLAAVGVNQYFDDGDTFGGQSVGLGVQTEITPDWTGRFEFLRDFDDSAFGTDVTTARLAVLYSF